MGKKLFAMLIVAVVAMFAGYNIYQSQNTVVLSDLALADVEALADSSEGCMSRPDDNNGDCTTDGSRYFCENSWWIDDCVKSEYPN